MLRYLQVNSKSLEFALDVPAVSKGEEKTEMREEGEVERKRSEE